MAVERGEVRILDSEVISQALKRNAKERKKEEETLYELTINKMIKVSSLNHILVFIFFSPTRSVLFYFTFHDSK